MAHYTKICEYGFVHAQCRCIGPKVIITCECNNLNHLVEATYVPKHRLDVPPV